MTQSTSPLLRVRNLTKQFPGVLALNSVELELYEGEFLSLIGENGAGKSTLMNLLYGLYQPDQGRILLDG
ncbi:MAG: ATP-binding cassette domain-containing protein, partial [Planctomycetaceae bacterium]|nr:ATP-binding cassette domain-containing protein [Planctomycetaceae bacterium]